MIKRNVCILLLLALITLYGCKSDSESKSFKKSIELANGKILDVVKTTTSTDYYGILTSHHYGTDNAYSYSFTLDHDIFWDGLSNVPKKILFAQDTIYIYSLKESYVSIPVDTLPKNTNSISNQKDSIFIERVYEKFIDDRYFFKQFGEAYWISIDAETYEKKKKNGQEFNIPTDNDLVE